MRKLPPEVSCRRADEPCRKCKSIYFLALLAAERNNTTVSQCFHDEKGCCVVIGFAVMNSFVKTEFHELLQQFFGCAYEMNTGSPWGFSIHFA